MEQATLNVNAKVLTNLSDIEGLIPLSVIHLSRHAATLLAKWHGKNVIVKYAFSKEKHTPTSAAIASIQHEVDVLECFDHPNVVRLVDSLPDYHLMILEYVPGRTIRDEMRVRRRLSALDIVSVGRQLSDSLHHIHARNIIHRDVKPANVMYDQGRVLLIDFHLAREPGKMRGGAGTRLFSAPEQVRGGIVTTAADMWGLGTILYRAATGRLPFHADQGHPQLDECAVPTLERLANVKYQGDMKRASAVIPRQLARVIDRMLSGDPRLRPTALEAHSIFSKLERSL